MTHHIAILILAAGGSSRFGSPKQLAPYYGTTLIRHVVQIALRSKASSITVVLGAEAKRITSELSGLSVQLVHNTKWQEGIGSSIRAGVTSLPQTADAALITLCDQPLVTSKLLNSIIDKHTATGKPLVASAYSSTLGVPALFARALFPELLSLQGDKGAKVVIQNHLDDVAQIAFPDGSLDIDTPGDLPQPRSQ